MKQIESHAIIYKIEKNLRAILGDVFYNEIKMFFRAFILANDINRILITRRSYVLYKIFCMIFSASLSEEDEKVRRVLEKGLQSVYTSHSIPLLLAKREKKALLIVDDIIVNGRTILNVIKKFLEQDSEWKINVWCLRCNAEAAFLDNLEPYLKHVIYISSYEWEMVSDRLTDAVIMSNIGYVSFLQTYWLTESSYNHLLKNFSKEDLSKDQTAQKKNIIKSNSKSNEGRFSLQCNYFLFEKGQYKNDYCAAIRFYKIENSYLAIPYVFLPSLTSEELLSLCKEIQNSEYDSLSKDAKNLIKYFAQNWTATEIENCLDVGVFAYQAIVNFLSDKFFYTILSDLPEKVPSDSIQLCFDSRESFSIQQDREKDLEALHKQIIYSLNKKETVENHLISNQHSNYQSDIEFCETILASSHDANEAFLDSMKKYFTVLRKEDDIRAREQESRLYGISIDSLLKCFAPAVSDRHFFNIAPYYLDLIYLWDIGLAACVILPSWDQQKKIIVFSEFIRHGEQAFRAIYSMYPNEYSILRRFAEITDFYTESEIIPFARHCANCSSPLDIFGFLNKIEFQTFFADCIAVSPKSVGACLDDEIINKFIKSYRN